MDDRRDRNDPDKDDLRKRREDYVSFVEELEASYAKWERHVKEEAFREMLVNVYETRFGPLPPALREAIEAMEDEPTLLQWGTLFGTATADEIAAALLPGQPGSQPAPPAA